MELNFVDSDQRLVINGYGAGYIEIANQRITSNCVVSPSQILVDILPDTCADLAYEHIRRCMEFEPDVMLIGTGAQQNFPHKDLLRLLIESGIGYEFMDTAAACRCYNILIAEHRRVVAALFIAR